MNVERMVKTHWTWLRFPIGKAHAHSWRPAQVTGQSPPIGTEPLGEGRLFLRLHHPCQKRAVACTWEPGASAPSFIPIPSTAIEVLLLLGVSVLSFWFWICSVKTLKNANVFFSVRTCQCNRSCISVGIQVHLCPQLGVFLFEYEFDTGICYSEPPNSQPFLGEGRHIHISHSSSDISAHVWTNCSKLFGILPSPPPQQKAAVAIWTFRWNFRMKDSLRPSFDFSSFYLARKYVMCISWFPIPN